MAKLSIRKGSEVEVIAGQDKGKKGTVLSVDPKKLKLKVQGVRVQTHFDKKDGLKTIEGFLDYSNVKLVGAPAKAAGKKPAKKKSAGKSA